MTWTSELIWEFWFEMHEAARTLGYKQDMLAAYEYMHTEELIQNGFINKLTNK